MSKIIISGAYIVNEGEIFTGDVLVEDEIIVEIGNIGYTKDAHRIDAHGKFLLPGIIDTHVHFREPGLTEKADIYTESKAAVAGGITSYIEMPNTVPNVFSKEQLSEKYYLASRKSWANYAFYMGVCHKNIDFILNLPHNELFGITDDGLYMTGEDLMLSEAQETMERLFYNYKGLIAIHSEDEGVIQNNLSGFYQKYGNAIPFSAHPSIRSELACYLSTRRAVALAKRWGTKLHLLHLTSSSELNLLESNKNVSEKKITAEVCIPHLIFCEEDYENLGPKIKCNPSIKTATDRSLLLKAVNEDKIDIISTDHAPHTSQEKELNYTRCPSGMPMVQHALPLMLEFYQDKKIKLEKIAEKMCHNPAALFGIEKRGFIREGYFADLVLVDLNAPWTVSKSNILYKCGWSPLESYRFRSGVTTTIINGNVVYHKGRFIENFTGAKLVFNLR